MTCKEHIWEIVLGVTGSIAAYKACELVRLMVKANWGVSVVMTEAAAKFVTPLTFQTLSRRPVALDPFALVNDWQPGHIALAERADIFLVAHCTANEMAKMTHGIADDELTATALACRGKVMVAPAMNVGMWENPATQANLEILRSRGIGIVEPESGELACGTTGRGRMAEPSTIFSALEKELSRLG